MSQQNKPAESLTSGTVTVTPQAVDQYIVVWPVSTDPTSQFNMNIGDKITTEFLLSKLTNAGYKGIVCFNTKNAIITDSKVVITIQEK
jgi:hypothetical protein